MKVAVISDLHGNWMALKEILQALEKEKCDEIYCLGDCLAIGPHSLQCLSALLSIPNLNFVRGNHEQYYLSELSSDWCHNMSEGEKSHQRWVASTLSNTLKETLAEFPFLIEKNIHGTKVAFMHYAMDEKNHFKPIEKEISPKQMDNLFEEIEADLIFYGHEHHASNVRGQKHYINVGSSGCTKGNLTHYTMVDFKEEGYEVQVRYVVYQKNLVLKALDDENVPEKEFIKQIFF